MITTIYKCDKCGKEQPKPEQMWWIAIRYTHHGGNINDTYTPNKYQEKLFCRECMEKLGILFSEKQAEKKTVPPSFEEVLREIIREEIGEAQSS